MHRCSWPQAAPRQVQVLRQLGLMPTPRWPAPCGATTTRALLRAVVQSTRQVRIDDDAFAAARAVLGSDRLLFELIAVTAAYNMVSRVLVAFDVQP
jgi:alkylhydroperoxidase family enzyme